MIPKEKSNENLMLDMQNIIRDMWDIYVKREEVSQIHRLGGKIIMLFCDLRVTSSFHALLQEPKKRYVKK